MPARHLTISHYPPQGASSCVEIDSPAWNDVAAAIERMDDDVYPIVQLSWKSVGTCFDDEQSFNIIGGGEAGFAVFEFYAEWRFEDPDGGDEDVRLWRSDQGYFCQRKNITDLPNALALAKVYFETGSYDAVRRACAGMMVGAR